MVRQNVAFFHTLKLTHSDLKVGIVCMPGANTTDVNWDTIFSPSLLVRECTLWYNNRGSELWTTSADYTRNCIGNGVMQIFIFCALYWNAIRYSRKGIAWELEMTYTLFVLCSDRYHIGFKFGSLGQVEEMTIRYYCEFTLGSAKLSCFIHFNKKTFVRSLYILLLNMF